MLQIGMACLAGAVLATLVALFATGNAGPRAGASVASIPAPTTPATQTVTLAALPSAAETVQTTAAAATVSAMVEPTKGAVTLPPTAVPTQPPPVVPTYVPVYVPVPSSTPLPLPISTRLTGLKFERQLFNNCGPATISMLINALGEKTDQTEAMGVLRPVNGPTGDRNVNPDELQAYAATKNIQTRLMVGGTVDELKRLVALGVPVIVETWYVPFPNDEMGHYQLLVGFDGDDLVFYDSFHGPNVTQIGRAHV